MKKRIYEYDIVRMIATLSVIVVHISAMAIVGFEAYSPHSILTIFLNRLLKYTTPVFVYLAGSLIYESYKNRPFTYSRFVIGRSKRILIPYVLISLMYYGFLTYVSRGTLSVADFMMQTITGSVQYHLYFIPIIIQLYLLTPVFLYLKKKLPLQVLMPLLIIISYWSTLMMKFKYSDRIFIKFMVPYVLGLYFGGQLIGWLKTLNKKMLALISVTLASGVYYAYMFMKYFYGEASSELLRDSGWFIYCILSCFTLTWVGMYLSKSKGFVKVSAHFSKLSYYIYLLHPLFIAVGVRLMNKLGLISTSGRFAFNLVFVIAVSVIAAQLVYMTLKINVWQYFRKLHKLKQVAVIVLMVLVGGVSTVYAYDLLVDRGYIISYESKREAKRIEKMINDYKTSEAWYENHVYGFEFNHEGFDVDSSNENIKTTFENDDMIVDIFYENLEGTVHTTDSFTFYGNRSIVDGEYVVVLEDQFMTIDGHNVHSLMWDRKALKHIETDYNHYLSIDIIKNTYEVYNITVRSLKDIDKNDLIARFAVTEKTADKALAQKVYNRKENKYWNDETKTFYENFSTQDMKWGFFEPTTISELETLTGIEEAVDYKFNYLLQYYNLDSYVNVEQINELYDQGRHVEFTLQTSEYYNPSQDVTFELLDGHYDEQIEQFAQKIARINGPVLFRLNNEMTGDWVFYNAHFYQKDTSLYVHMWQYIYDKFVEVGADNVVWVFNPNESSFPGFKWNHCSNYFPGEDYVDIIGVTGYNTGDYHIGEIWRSFEEIYDEFMPEYNRVFGEYPMMVTEFGSSTFGGNKVEWMEEMFSVIDKYGFKAAIYWNSIDKDPADGVTPARTYRFTDDPAIVEVFKNHLDLK